MDNQYLIITYEPRDPVDAVRRILDTLHIRVQPGRHTAFAPMFDRLMRSHRDRGKEIARLQQEISARDGRLVELQDELRRARAVKQVAEAVDGIGGAPTDEREKKKRDALVQELRRWIANRDKYHLDSSLLWRVIDTIQRQALKLAERDDVDALLVSLEKRFDEIAETIAAELDIEIKDRDTEGMVEFLLGCWRRQKTSLREYEELAATLAAVRKAVL